MGLSIATLLAQHHEVTAVDIVQERVDMVNWRQSPIQDDYIERFFAEDVQLKKGVAPSVQKGFMLKAPLSLQATTDWEHGYANASFVVIAAPTNYDSAKNFFDTSAVEDVIGKVMQVNPKAVMVIKSTIPVGYTEAVSAKIGTDRIIFAPEFLRESKALYDNLYPSRIIVGYKAGNAEIESAAHTFAGLIAEGAAKEDVPILYMGTTEAEAVKLFANTYLALRVSYFNELDTYAEIKGLDTQKIIEGVCLDPRIGSLRACA